MKNKISWQQFKRLLFANGIFALLLVATDKASAIAIKDTNYEIPTDAYFVSPDGKDTNSGTDPASPWSVTKALASAPPGSTIVFRGGTYRNVKASINKKLTLQAYPHEQAWLKGSIEVKGWVTDGSRWRKDRWYYSFPNYNSSEYIDPKYPMAGYRDMVYINDVSLKQVKTKDEVVPGTFYVDDVNDQLYIGNDPTGKMVEATALKEGFSVLKSSSSDPSSTIIRGLGFAHYADRGITLGAARVTLENNTFAWNGQQGVSTTGSYPEIVVRGNTFSYNGRVGFRINSAHRMLLEGNTISYNNVERFAKNYDAAGVKATKTDSLLWRNNLVERNFATGMWVDTSSTNATIVHNTSRYNQGGMGIFFEISHKAIIASNIAYRNSVGIIVSNSSSAKVYNNTLANNNKNLVLKDTTRNNTNTTEIAAGITWIARDNTFKNNILSNTTGGALFDASNCNTKERSALMIAADDYNAYYRTSSTKPQSVVSWALGSSNCSVGYNSIAAFSSATGFEQNALAIDDVATNPFFVDEANENYRLKPDSPAIARGEGLPEDVANAIGVAPGVPVDMGALQQIVLVQ